jgi:hypothetical protein
MAASAMVRSGTRPRAQSRPVSSVP